MVSETSKSSTIKFYSNKGKILKEFDKDLIKHESMHKQNIKKPADKGEYYKSQGIGQNVDCER